MNSGDDRLYSRLLHCGNLAFEDEAHPATDNLPEHLRDGGALVPNLWHLEVGKLLQAEKRRRITATQVSVRLELLANPDYL